MVVSLDAQNPGGFWSRHMMDYVSLDIRGVRLDDVSLNIGGARIYNISLNVQSVRMNVSLEV